MKEKRFVMGKENKILFGCSALSAFLVLMFCSKCSFLYPFQDGMDANCFFTVGKAIANGQVLYRDIYEHKGLLLYLLYAVAYLFSENTFIGIFWLEVICGTFFLFYAYKTVELFVVHPGKWMMPVLAYAAYSGYAFSYGGQAEELVLPILAWALYVFFSYMEKDYPKGTPLSWKKVFLMGAFAAILFWIKYTLTGLYLALVLFMVILKWKEKKGRELLRMAMCFLGGFLVVTLPVFLYFWYHNALQDLWEVYFYNMIFRYNARDVGMSKLEYSLRKILLTFWRNKRFSLLVTAGILYMTFSKKAAINKLTKVGMWMICVITTLAVFYSTQYNRYWGLILSIFSCLGFVPVFEWIRSHAIGKYFLSDHEKRWLRKGNGFFCKSFIIALVCCTFLARLTGMNTYLLEYTRQELPQYIFKEVIRQDGVEEPVILNYGCLDLGLYTVTGTLPGCKYFCDYNINYSEIYDTQEAFILGGQADYIVLRNSLEVGEELYEEAAQCYFEMEFNDYYQTYYLYRRRDI